MTRTPSVLLVRHGRTALNVAGQLRGHLDPPLDATGQAEARDLAADLAGRGPVRILTSPWHGPFRPRSRSRAWRG